MASNADIQLAIEKAREDEIQEESEHLTQEVRRLLKEMKRISVEEILHRSERLKMIIDVGVLREVPAFTDSLSRVHAALDILSEKMKDHINSNAGKKIGHKNGRTASRSE